MSNNKIYYDRPTAEQLEEELSRMHGEEVNKAKKQMIWLSIMGAVAVLIIVFFCFFPVVSADGHIFILSRLSSPAVGDKAVISYGNRNICRVVIAGAGDSADVDAEGNVFVNGTPVKVQYETKTVDNGVDIDLPCTVPDGKYFVISGDINSVPDSRNTKLGCVEEGIIVGVVIITVK